MDLFRRSATVFLICTLAFASACGQRTRSTDISSAQAESTTERTITGNPIDGYYADDPGNEATESIWTLFNRQNQDVVVNVNKYLWAASLEVLDFLPVQSVDPFSGVISTGYGTPPGGGRSYRATVYIRDPALDARSLNVALQTRGGGAVSAGTTRAVEDAILTRARQLRIADSRF